MTHDAWPVSGVLVRSAGGRKVPLLAQLQVRRWCRAMTLARLHHATITMPAAVIRH